MKRGRKCENQYVIKALAIVIFAHLLFFNCSSEDRNKKPHQIILEDDFQNKSIVKSQIKNNIARLNDSNPFVRKHAIIRLGALKANNAIDEIIKKYETETRSDLKRISIDALGNIGDNKAMPTIKHALKSENIEIRKAAKQAAIKINYKKQHN